MMIRQKLLLLPLILLIWACRGNAFQEEKKADKAHYAFGNSAQRMPSTYGTYKVKKFVDGDTFYLDDSTAKGTKIRLIGIDAPESRKVGNRKEEHPMGKQVSAYVQELLQHQHLRVELDVAPRDQYGRVLAYIWMENGQMLNEHLLEMGYAMLMTVPPNVKYVDRFVAALESGKIKQIGLWSNQ